MSIPRHIKEFLDSRNVRYKHCTHSPVYTAQEIAHAQHVSGKQLAKSVMVLADGKLVMAVLPASERLDVEKLEELIGATSIRLAEEEEFKDIFPGCELGAMPPFGNLYDIPVWVDATLESVPVLYLNAGTHTDTIEMRFGDFVHLVEPHLARIGEVTKAGSRI